MARFRALRNLAELSCWYQVKSGYAAEIGLLRRNGDSDARERHAWSPVSCADYRCSHSVAISGDPRPDDVRSSDIAAQFVCRACGKRDADVRPDFNWMSGQPMPR